MANAAKINAFAPVRMMIVGYPGSAKTGSLASLANMGYKLRILDFDGNTEPLIKFTKPEFLANIDILSFEDKLRMGAKHFETVGLPSAFANAVKAMDRWKYLDGEQEVDLGASKDWGCDTIVVLDSLTSMGQAGFRRVQAMLNKTPLNTTQQVWGIAMSEQEAFIEKLTAKSNRYHVIVLSHLKMIGPKDVMRDDADLTKDLKEKIADLVPTRLFPSALGQALPPMIGGHFPTLIQAEAVYKGTSVRRVLHTLPRPDLDLKVPSPNLPAELDISDGLSQIFSVLAPPLASCAGSSEAPASDSALTQT